MASETIDGHRLHDYIVSGAQYLISSEHDLNRINVFPVADGDTGTNLAFTMRTIVRKSQAHPTVSGTLDSVATVAMESAYGNSGLIFAQYLQGLSLESRDRESLTLREFAELAHRAVRHAYEAVANPVEGTILTVMKGWAAELGRIQADGRGLEEALGHSVQEARRMVEQTRTTLKVLRRHNVVDAGAKGFLIFLEGFYDFAKTGTFRQQTLARVVREEAGHENPLTERVTGNIFCSQFSVRTTEDPQGIRDKLGSLGDSLVLGGDETLRSVHLHTDRPDEVMQYLTGIGEVLGHHVEDLRLASDIMARRKHSIALVTDSIADLPREFLYDAQITMVPLNLICDSTAYLDKITMAPGSFYDRWDTFALSPTSSQPTMDTMEKAFAGLVGRFDSVIGIFISGEMSGTVRNARQVAERLRAQGHRIDIVDSRLNSAAEGLLVREAARLRDEGLSHDELLEAIEALREKIRIYVVVQDLGYMIRGGRISRSRGIVLKIVKFKPVISIDEQGKGSIHKMTLSPRKAEARILDQVRADARDGGVGRYALVYADDPGALSTMRESLREILGRDADYEEQISPVVGLNAGRGAYAVAYIKGDGDAH